MQWVFTVLFSYPMRLKADFAANFDILRLKNENYESIARFLQKMLLKVSKYFIIK